MGWGTFIFDKLSMRQFLRRHRSLFQYTFEGDMTNYNVASFCLNENIRPPPIKLTVPSLRSFDSKQTQESGEKLCANFDLEKLDFIEKNFIKFWISFFLLIEWTNHSINFSDFLLVGKFWAQASIPWEPLGDLCLSGNSVLQYVSSLFYFKLCRYYLPRQMPMTMISHMPP